MGVSFDASFALADVCECGSMSSRTSTAYAVIGECCCKSSIDKEYSSHGLSWEPTGEEVVYKWTGAETITGASAKSSCCESSQHTFLNSKQ